MPFRWFVFILIAGAFFTVFLASCKTFARPRFSWFAVPLPFLIAVAALGGPYILAVLLSDQ